jgi:predicted  nucleic acid-binding Zn-ribbon protein
MPLNRFAMFALGTVLLFCSYDALGQHGGHGGSGGHGNGPKGSGAAPDTSLQDFNHAMAVQATPDQVSQFQTMAKSTEAAKKQAQELLQLASKADRSADFTHQTTALKDALEDAQGGNKYFMKSFSKSQKAGLKDLTKKLEKADSDVAKQRKVLDQQVGQSKTDSAGIAGTADKLEKALEEFQSQQLGLAKEMGIQTPAM